MRTLHVKTTRSLGLIPPSATLIAVLAGALVLTLPRAQANETVTWHRQALGQTNICPNSGDKWVWPNNNNWSQSQLIGEVCPDHTSVVLQPSNWSTTNYPDGSGYDVVLGSWGGAPANLDLGVMLHSLTIQSDGGLNMQWGSSITANAFDFQGDSGITHGGGSGSDPTLTLAQDGSLTKSAGAGTFTIVPGVVLKSSSGTFTVTSGTLALPGLGSSYTNCTFNVASGATLNLVPAGHNAYFFGVVLGAGGGTLLLNGGNLNAGDGGVTLMLPASLFQWTGGNMVGVRNAGTITVSGAGGVGIGGAFNNEGTLQFKGSAGLNEPWGSGFNNLATGTIDFQTDAGFSIGGGSGGDPYFNNWGLVRKSGGTNTTVIASRFNNQGGTIQVDSGKLSLSGGGGSSNGTFIVAAGAALDLTGGVFPTWVGQMTGSGAGQVLLSGGTINTDPGLTLNLPAGLFQWTGGGLGGTTINSNVVTIAGSGSVYVAGGFYNRGLVHHTNTATLGIRSSGHFENEAGGTYNLEGDGSVAHGGGGGLTPYFSNAGLLRKSSGSGTSAVGIFFYNLDGSIEVDSGTLSLGLGSYSQGAGALTVKLGGRGAGQFGQLSVSGGASLGGPFNVTLANGFAPAPGDSFQILACSGRSGVFSATNVPAGMAVNYSNNGVFLVVTGTVPAQIVEPALFGGNLTFSFGTVTNQNYTIQYNDNLSTNDWRYYTNLTGDGAMKQIATPVTGSAHRFFRVRQP